MTEQSAAAHAMPAEAQLLQIATGFFASTAVFVAAKLDIAELLASGPKTAAELAELTGTNEDALYRVLRSIESIGVFAETDDRTFSNTPMSEALRSGAANSARDLVIFMLEDACWRAHGELLYSVKTGKPSWDKVFGEPIFASFVGSQRDLGTIFNRAMTSYSRQTIPAILSAYDFSGAGTVADIGGGLGHLLGAVLRANPGVKGVLFEIPAVLGDAPAMLESYGMADRATLVGGDFVEAIPVQADIYMLKHIIHDWYDDKCGVILGNIRSVMPDRARVLIIDSVVPPPGVPHYAKFLDLEMLMLPGGKERTAKEFETLLANSGFRLTRIIPTPTPVSIVEAEKA